MGHWPKAIPLKSSKKGSMATFLLWFKLCGQGRLHAINGDVECLSICLQDAVLNRVASVFHEYIYIFFHNFIIKNNF